MRKVEPLTRALADYDAYASGIRRDESPTRAGTAVVEWDHKRGKVKVNPIARWTQDDVDAYVAENGILVNPLADAGFPSIGVLDGKRHYREARRLLICADSGGGNGSRQRAWKVQLQGLSDEIGMPITVCHYPPGTSKWNKIEHRLFSFISLNWKGKPLDQLRNGSQLDR